MFKIISEGIAFHFDDYNNRNHTRDVRNELLIVL